MKYDKLIDTIQGIDTQLQSHVRSTVNKSLILRNWCVGAFIVEFEKNGEDRAKYGEKLYASLANDLESMNVKGLSKRNLHYATLFYNSYPQIVQMLSAQSGKSISSDIRKMLSIQLKTKPDKEISNSNTDNLENIVQTPSAQLRNMTSIPCDKILQFTWSHLIELSRIQDQLKRSFYEVECLKGTWSVRQLKRQIESLFFERTGLSTNKKKVVECAHLQTKESNAITEDIIRDPYVLEFVGLAEMASYSENDLEKALLDHLQSFLLELGNGFCFESRQKRITVGNEHDRVDLVFYHRRLRCHILVDLKIRAFSHQDAGQMNFYLNYFKDQEMLEGDNPPIGIILCSDKEGTKVEYATAGMDSQLFVSRYLIELPNPEELEAFIEKDRHIIEEEVAKVDT